MAIKHVPRKTSRNDKVQVNTRLFRTDVVKLQREARDVGVPWQTLLRSALHRYLNGEARVS